MQEIKTLIDKASKVCGSDAALASRMGVKAPVISMMRTGVRTITPETAAELADIAGESVKAAVYQAMIERAAGTRREGVLKEILGKSLLAGVAAMLLFSYAPEVKAESAYKQKVSKLVNLIFIVEDQGCSAARIDLVFHDGMGKQSFHDRLLFKKAAFLRSGRLSNQDTMEAPGDLALRQGRWVPWLESGSVRIAFYDSFDSCCGLAVS